MGPRMEPCGTPTAEARWGGERVAYVSRETPTFEVGDEPAQGSAINLRPQGPVEA